MPRDQALVVEMAHINKLLGDLAIDRFDTLDHNKVNLTQSIPIKVRKKRISKFADKVSESKVISTTRKNKKTSSRSDKSILDEIDVDDDDLVVPDNGFLYDDAEIVSSFPLSSKSQITHILLNNTRIVLRIPHYVNAYICLYVYM
jgi:hypothetical protein